MPWWTRLPDILQQEVRELTEAGFTPEVDAEEKTAGRLVIRARVPIGGADQVVTIRYPDLYPYFRPHFVCTGLSFARRHYDEPTGILCLLERGSENWNTDMTAARLLTEQVEQWTALASASGASDGDQAEPVGDYVETPHFATIMVDSLWEIPLAADRGRLAIWASQPLDRLFATNTFRGFVLKVLDSDGTAIASASDRIVEWTRRFQAHHDIDARWIRLRVPLPFRKPDDVLPFLERYDRWLRERIDQDLGRGRSGLLGFRHPEEIRPGEMGENWMFFAYQGRAKRGQKRKGTRLASPTFHLIRAEPCGEADLFERIPELHPLRGKTVAVVGLGCVGAPSVLSLARSGVGRLRLLDHDRVSPGAICRWPVGLLYAGGPKSEVLREFIDFHYPMTKVLTDHYLELPDGSRQVGERLGDIGANRDQMEMIEAFVKDADLIYDAASEEGITHLFSDLAKERGIPLVVASSRTGGWGGEVLRLLPGPETACYLCYLHWRRDREIPTPPHDPRARVQPRGCGDVTFHAADFDIAEIAATGVRMAVGELCRETAGAYPRVEKDVGILCLRDGEASLFPRWTARDLPRHPRCGCST
jgi:hypothetical protein